MARITVATMAEVRLYGLCVKRARKEGHTKNAAKIRELQKELREGSKATFGGYVEGMQEREYKGMVVKKQVRALPALIQKYLREGDLA